MNIIIVNTNKRRGLAESEYRKRRGLFSISVTSIRKFKNIRFLSDLSTNDFNELSHAIEDETIVIRGRHVIAENEPAMLAAAELIAGNIE